MGEAGEIIYVNVYFLEEGYDSNNHLPSMSIADGEGVRGISARYQSVRRRLLI